MDTGGPKEDIRDVIFKEIQDLLVTSAISNTSAGMISGVGEAVKKAEEIGLDVVTNVRDGMFVHENETIMMLRGTPKQTAVAEETMIGILAKASGVSTAAMKAVGLAGGRAEIVCGSFKKLPQSLKIPLRHAILQAGAKVRIAPFPFVYLDKNYIRMFGSVKAALEAVRCLEDHTVVIQLRNESGNLRQETVDACANGANLLMIDTGNARDIPVVVEILESMGIRRQIKLAFAGNVKLEDIPSLCSAGVDIICIGRDIADAPLMDMKFDVINAEERVSQDDFSMNLLEKSELWVEKIEIEHVDLNEVAVSVAKVLGMEEKDVLVVDVRRNHITLDILRRTVDAGQIAGKERELLDALGRIRGVHLTEESFIHSNGVLGLIALDPSEVEDVLKHTYEVANTVKEAFNRRACVFPTGFEVQEGMIKDTNSPYIAGVLEDMGYEVNIKPPISDNCDTIRGSLEAAIDEGYSLIITTGGVGAEDKDFTVEAVMQIDPHAAAPWLVKYQKGTGRHVKDGIRIAVGEAGQVKIVALPGPNDEVRMAMDVLAANLVKGFHKYKTAEEIASVLRQKIKGGWKH